MNDKKQACVKLREVLRHRLMAWDAASAAEKLLGCDIDSQSDEVECFLSGLNVTSDADDVSDEDILALFEVDHE
jgi:hypothetical protein